MTPLLLAVGHIIDPAGHPTHDLARIPAEVHNPGDAPVEVDVELILKPVYKNLLWMFVSAQLPVAVARERHGPRRVRALEA